MMAHLELVKESTVSMADIIKSYPMKADWMVHKIVEGCAYFPEYF